MSEKSTSGIQWKRNAGMLIAIFLGITAIILAPKLKKPPKPHPIIERATKVRSIVVESLDVVPRSIGFGRVSPGRTWESVAEISGQVIWVSDELRDGKVVAEGTELLRIDDSNYQLILAQAEAQLEVSVVNKQTAREGLAMAKKHLSLLKSEYKRQQKLAAKGTVSKNTLESFERQVLVGQTQVQDFQNTLKLITAEYQVLIAQRDVAQLDLDRTLKKAPFDARITQVDIGIAQYANQGQLMFTADGLEIAEIEAQFSVGTLRPLIKAMARGNTSNVRAGATGLNALVRLRTPTHMVEWPARVDRVAGTIDPLTQALGVIVAVDHPYALAQPGERPPLLRDTFVEVELRANPILQQIVVPQNSIHNGTIYIVNNDSRLEFRKVVVNFSLQGYAVIAKGLKPGERIVTSELITAIEDMLLVPVDDKKSKQQIILETGGKDTKQ